jgi:hypothetical protein
MLNNLKIEEVKPIKLPPLKSFSFSDVPENSAWYKTDVFVSTHNDKINIKFKRLAYSSGHSDLEIMAILSKSEIKEFANLLLRISED